MLDIIRQLIVEALETSTAEVNKEHDALLKERASADGRYAAKTALHHPEGSTTPLEDTYLRAQKRYARLREQAENDLPKALAKVIALQIAEQRRDEALANRNLQREADADYVATGVKVDTRDWMGRLVRHGVYPNYLKAQTDENVAIIADLLSWKSKDPTYSMPDNPWRAVLHVYGGRRIEKPGKRAKAERSVSGTPTRNRHIPELGDYMFNEMIKPHWGGMPSPAAPTSSIPTAPTPAPVPTPATSVAAETDAMPENGVDTAPTISVQPGQQPESADIQDTVNSDDVPSVSSSLPNPPAVAPLVDKRTAIPIDHDRALAFAEAFFKTNPVQMRIYWPQGWTDYSNFEPGSLVPALEAWVGTGGVWAGGVEFLEAARQGAGQDFIAKRRRWGIEAFARRLEAGDEKALEQVKAAGIHI